MRQYTSKTGTGGGTMHGDSRKRRWVPVGLASFGLASWMALAGNLNPPSPPAPTMKDLDTVEPRIPIHASGLPLTINTPGSYYLAEDIDTVGAGITIATSNVTVDLEGFTLSGGLGKGIFISAIVSAENVVIKNGTITGWSNDGIDIQLAPNSQIIAIRAEGNGHDGIISGAGSLVSGCTTKDNTRNGITVVGDGTIIESSTAYRNLGDGIVLNNGIVSRCTAIQNGDAAGEDGIDGGGGSLIRDSLARANAEDGIQCSSGCSILHNESNNNGVIVAGSGIRVTSTTNR